MSREKSKNIEGRRGMGKNLGAEIRSISGGGGGGGVWSWGRKLLDWRLWEREREREWCRQPGKVGVIHLFNGISTPYELFNAGLQSLWCKRVSEFDL